MLPRIVPESQTPTYDQNGQLRVRYTSVWATRPLGSVAPTTPTATPQADHVPDENSVATDEKHQHWEPKNTYGNICWALFFALFELYCALALTCLGVYHWDTGEPSNIYTQDEAAQLLQTGVASSIVAAFSVVAFYPRKRGRVTKRVVILFTFPVVILLVESIALISGKIAFLTYQNSSVDGFYIAEVILASLILLFVGVALYPASEGAVPFEYQRSAALRALAISVNTLVGAVVLIYFCFSIYGVHAAFDTDTTDAVNSKLQLSVLIVPITSLLLLSMLGAFTAIGRGVRPHILPTLVIGTISSIIFFSATTPYVQYLNNYTSNDWRDDAYVGMFVLNWLSLAGLAVLLPLGVGFAFY